MTNNSIGDARIPQPREKFSTTQDIEEMKQYKGQETLTANNVSYVKVQIMLVEEIMFKGENICKL